MPSRCLRTNCGDASNHFCRRNHRSRTVDVRECRTVWCLPGFCSYRQPSWQQERWLGTAVVRHEHSGCSSFHATHRPIKNRTPLWRPGFDFLSAAANGYFLAAA